MRPHAPLGLGRAAREGLGAGRCGDGPLRGRVGLPENGVGAGWWPRASWCRVEPPAGWSARAGVTACVFGNGRGRLEEILALVRSVAAVRESRDDFSRDARRNLRRNLATKYSTIKSVKKRDQKTKRKIVKKNRRENRRVVGLENVILF